MPAVIANFLVQRSTSSVYYQTQHRTFLLAYFSDEMNNFGAGLDGKSGDPV